MPDQRKIIGIAGGLGPYAHIDFEEKLLVSANELLSATRDEDYPEWIVSSVPQTPDRTSAIEGDAPDPSPWLLRSFRRLQLGTAETPGADFIAVPCNSAHHYLEKLRREVRIPILDMIQETADHVAALHPSACVGLLATTGTLKTRMYHSALEAGGLRAVSPLELTHGEAAQRRLVMEAIYGPFRNGRFVGGGIKSKGAKTALATRIIEACGALVDRLGADVIIAGCTEIPLVLHPETVSDVPIIDPARVLADASIRLAYDLS